jgi:predicted O-methyltransferase YrrM
MSRETWTAVDDFFAQLLAKPDPVLEKALAHSEASGLPAIGVSPNLGKFLQLLAQMVGAKRILEVGTLGGYSTTWLARALPEGGSITTLESNEIHVKVANANLARAGLSEVVDIRLGPAQQTLQQLEADGDGPYDFIFLDADKASLPEYFAWALKLARPGAVIVADNVVRNGAVIDATSSDPNVQGVRRFLEMVAAEPQVSAVAMQTVGEKGYDGFAIALVAQD